MQQKLGYRPKLLWNDGVHEYLSKAYGSEHFQKICEALTRPSKYSSIRVNSLQTTASDLLLELKNYTSSATKCYEHPSLKNVIVVQGNGPHQVCYEEQGQPQKIVMVSRKCAEAVLRGAEVFVPGVLACSEHVDEGDTVAVLARIEVKDSHGKWSNGITRGTTLPLDNWEDCVGERPNDWFIGKGRAMMSRPTLFRETQGLAVKVTHRVYNLPALHGVLPGKMFLQNLPSIVAAMVLDPKPGERILDMCAAPGGKTTAIAALMGNVGEVIALDRSHSKVLSVSSLAKELGLSCIQAYKMDALKSVQEELPTPSPHSSFLEKEVKSFIAELADTDAPQTGTLEAESAQYTSRARERKEARKLKNGPARVSSRATSFPPGSFDRVLLDAPCSALGLRPKLFAAEETLESLGQHASYQRRMFDKAVQLVRPGGTIVYSTCTINPGENEALVRYALDKYKLLQLCEQVPRVGGPGLVGGTDTFDGHGCREWLRKGEEDLVQRFDPSSSLDTIGFFIAKFHLKEK